MLEIRNLVRRYGGKTVLDRISFSVPERSVWALAGANGAGKTTLLRAIAALDEADGGDVLWRGKSLLDRNDLPLDAAALMPETLSDASDVTVADYLDFHARTLFDKKTARGRSADAARLAGVKEAWKNLFLDELSRGMKQRVSLARMLIFSPPVLLFDEPGEGLDPRALSDLRALFARLAGEGHTVLVSSHLLSELAGIVSGWTFLERGKVAASGTMRELSGRYGTSDAGELYMKITRED